jgi:hypothetical protein
MAKKINVSVYEPGPPKRTSIGSSSRSRPKNKGKRANHKPYNRQGR